MISIVGSETPLGRELREQLSEKHPAGRVQLLGSEAGDTSILTAQEGEPVLMLPVEQERLLESDIVMCAGSQASARKAFELAGNRSRPLFVDLTYGLEDQPSARLRAPFSVDTDEAFAPNTLHVIAHPAAAALAMILTRLQKNHKIQHAVVQVLEPASERGQAGLSELQQQTTSLLSFRPLNKQVFDAQLGFNVLARYGEQAPEQLQDIEMRVDRHLATLLAGATPMPSIRLIQAPVFHGYSLSLWVHFETRLDVSAISETLASAQVEVRSPDLDPPSNVGVVGQPGVTVGIIEQDRNYPGAVWLWAVCDNYRMSVDSAIEVARQLERGERI
jgi:aspartate-semialdehyde dehydrogenase